MIFGIGCDLCEIARIEKTDLKFLEKCFTQKEQEYFSRKHNKYESIAAAFAAKEAFSKAIGTGIRGFSFADIEVLHDELGKPYINVTGSAKAKCEEEKVSDIHLSLSHTEALAMACVVLERKSL